MAADDVGAAVEPLHAPSVVAGRTSGVSSPRRGVVIASRAAVTAEILLLGLVAIPYWVAGEVLALRWNPRRIDLVRLWQAVCR